MTIKMKGHAIHTSGETSLYISVAKQTDRGLLEVCRPTVTVLCINDTYR